MRSKQLGNRYLPVFEDEDEMATLANSGDTGFCVSCGEEAYGVEPDARKYECESCEAKAVYGYEELLMAGHFMLEQEGGTHA